MTKRSLRGVKGPAPLLAQKSECERVWEREFPFGRARGGAYTFNSFPRLWRGCWDIKSRKEEESLVLRGK